MKKAQTHVARSLIQPGNQQNKIPSSVRSTFLNRTNSIAEHEDFGGLIRRSVFMTAECKLCLNKFQRDKMVSLSDCNHRFCTSCMDQYIIYKLNVMEDVVCPQQNCNQLLDTNNVIFTDLPQQYKDKYKKFELWKQTVNNPNLKLCPAQKCNGVIDIASKKYQCQQCKIVYCPECMLKKHEGPCDTNFQRNFSNWKRCPDCKMFIEKNEGCNHITCRCTYQFCYVCLDKWKQEHYKCGQAQPQTTQARQWIIDQGIIDQMSTSKRIFLIILMIVLFPVFLGLGIIALAIVEACAIVLGLLCGGCALGNEFLSQHCCCCLGVIIFCPFITAVAMIFAAIKVFVQAIRIGSSILIAYFKNMCNLIPFRDHQQEFQLNEMQF